MDINKWIHPCIGNKSEKVSLRRFVSTRQSCRFHRSSSTPVAWLSALNYKHSRHRWTCGLLVVRDQLRLFTSRELSRHWQWPLTRDQRSPRVTSMKSCLWWAITALIDCLMFDSHHSQTANHEGKLKINQNTTSSTFVDVLVSVRDQVRIEWLHERTEHLNIFLFPPIIQWCSISNVLLLVEGKCQILDWLYKWFSQFHSCGTYSVLSRSHSVGCVLMNF